MKAHMGTIDRDYSDGIGDFGWREIRLRCSILPFGMADRPNQSNVNSDKTPLDSKVKRRHIFCNGIQRLENIDYGWEF